MVTAKEMEEFITPRRTYRMRNDTKLWEIALIHQLTWATSTIRSLSTHSLLTGIRSQSLHSRVKGATNSNESHANKSWIQTKTIRKPTTTTLWMKDMEELSKIIQIPSWHNRDSKISSRNGKKTVIKTITGREESTHPSVARLTWQNITTDLRLST